MKLLIKLMLVLCVVAVAAPFVLKGQDGQPLLNVDQLRVPSLSLPAFVTDLAEPSTSGGAQAVPLTGNGVRMYRWRDAQGTVHFAGEAPAGVQAEVLIVQDNITPLGADWIPEVTTSAPTPAPQIDNPLQAYRNADKVIEQAREAATLMEQHNQRIEAVARPR